MESCLFVGPDLTIAAVVTVPGISQTTERHHWSIDVPSLEPTPNVLSELNTRPHLLGVVFAMGRGWVGAKHLRFAAGVLRRNRRVWFYWPDELAIECVDRERVASYWRHWAVIKTFHAFRTVAILARAGAGILRGLLSGRSLQDAIAAVRQPGRWLELETCRDRFLDLFRNARPALLRPVEPSGAHRISGTGVYLRTDYWAPITSGGSYGHTCYVAKELAATTEQFVCLMANRYPLLDEYGLHQVVLPRPAWGSDDVNLPLATDHYYPALKTTLEALRPAYLYERLCLGNGVGALLSRELNLPYIVEYNGSEISMRRSFDGTGYANEDLLTLIEDAAFRQATIISVVSDAIKSTLTARGVDPEKILVNPNGADPAVYAPPSDDRRIALKKELGFAPADTVIGFSGTFGGWHGIEVLAGAIPSICANAPNTKFLLIGDGSRKPLVDATVADHDLAPRVRSVGRVPQREGARLLAACDLFVSPHNSHMVDSRFFGSPTKLFEYMAMGSGIVASDLEQMGEVLSPALRANNLASAPTAVTNERAVLCTPGDVDQFVSAVLWLVAHPEISEALGRNARQAVIDHYSWARHVGRLWEAIAAPRAAAALAAVARVETNDTYKEEVQNQWNHNPVGTHYAKESAPRTLEWFKEIEAYRYQEYAPWMLELMEFDRHSGQTVLEIGGGVGTDLIQFARGGAEVTDIDLSAGHLDHARQNFELRGLTGTFIHHDAEELPFESDSFDVVFSNGVLHHTPNTKRVVQQIRRVLRPGGRAIVMMYAENSLHYWRQLVWNLGLHRDLLTKYSMGEIMSRYVEISQTDARPLVKVYTKPRLVQLFDGFQDRIVYKRQLIADELPNGFKWIPLAAAGRLIGWNLIIKATKPRA